MGFSKCTSCGHFSRVETGQGLPVGEQPRSFLAPYFQSSDSRVYRHCTAAQRLCDTAFVPEGLRAVDLRLTSRKPSCNDNLSIIWLGTFGRGKSWQLPCALMRPPSRPPPNSSPIYTKSSRDGGRGEASVASNPSMQGWGPDRQRQVHVIPHLKFLAFLSCALEDLRGLFCCVKLTSCFFFFLSQTHSPHL